MEQWSSGAVVTRRNFDRGFNPLSPDIKTHILLTVFHTFLMELVRRMSKYQDILFLVITFFILIT